eukprot:IDg21152t1
MTSPAAFRRTAQPGSAGSSALSPSLFLGTDESGTRRGSGDYEAEALPREHPTCAIPSPLLAVPNVFSGEKTLSSWSVLTS